MEMFNLSINENLADWGIIRTAKQKILVLKNEPVECDVYKIPIDILLYNSKNGRMFMEAKRFESETDMELETLKASDPKRYNDEVENLIWSTNEERNNSTKRNIEAYGQIEPGVVLDNGVVIDGNRRFTCLRRLHREHPENERFSYFLAAIIKVDGKDITTKVIKEYELRIQFGNDEKVNYSVINKNMSIYELIENKENGFDYTTVAELLSGGDDKSKVTPGQVNLICKTCALVLEFLDYIKKSHEYTIAEDLKIYWPLEPLATYFNNEGKNLTQLEITKRKHLFFDYLLTLDVQLITQTLRDYLIKKVFKDNNITEDLIKEHKETIGNLIQETIQKCDNTEDFMDAIRDLRDSDAARNDKDNYDRTVAKLLNKNQISVPLNECRGSLKSLKNVNIDPLLNSYNTISEKNLTEIYSVLDEIIKTADALMHKIKNNNNNE